MIIVRMAREHSSVRGFAPEEMYKSYREMVKNTKQEEKYW